MDTNNKENKNNKHETEHISNNKLFFKDVVYIMSIVILAAALLFMVIVLPETIKNSSNQSEIIELKDYIKNLQQLLNSSLSVNDNSPQFSGIKIINSTKPGSSEIIALQDIDSDILNVTFSYNDENNKIINCNISSENMIKYITKFDSENEDVYYIEFSYELLAESFAEKGIDLYYEESFFILCKITFKNNYQHLIYIIGENPPEPSPLPSISPEPTPEPSPGVSPEPTA